MKTIRTLLPTLLALSLSGCSIFSIFGPKCQPQNIKLQLIPFGSQGNEAHKGVLQALSSKGFQVGVSPADYTLEGDVDYDFTSSGNKRISQLTVRASSDNKSVRTTISGHLHPGSEPNTLGYLAGKDIADKICDAN